jgi:hypothetical protein
MNDRAGCAFFLDFHHAASVLSRSDGAVVVGRQVRNEPQRGRRGSHGFSAIKNGYRHNPGVIPGTSPPASSKSAPSNNHL